MDVDTILVSLSHLPLSLRTYIHKLVSFASAVDSAVSLLETRVGKGAAGNDAKSRSEKNGNEKQAAPSSAQDSHTQYAKSIMSLRRLNLCFCDLFDMLESCVESIDNAKKRAIYAQIEPSIALIKNSLSDIQHNYAAQLEKEGISFSFADVDQGLDAFCEAVREESHKLLSVKPASYHPNILLVMTSGLNVEDVEDSIRRYIPRNDVFPCDEQPLSIPIFAESDLSGSYIRPASPGIMEWEDEGGDVLPSPEASEAAGAAGARPKRREEIRSNSPSIGQPIPLPNIAHFARIGVSLPHHYNAAGCECPGRASLLTGEYPPVHGVRTSLSKTGNCSELKIDEVPTLGHYLSTAGYDVVYKGEWGLSEVQAMLEHPLLDLLGVERSADEDLQPFGFQGWEAHREEDWYGKSIQITNEAVEYIRRRECVMSAESLRGSEPPPWALVVSYPDIIPDCAELRGEQREQLVDPARPVFSPPGMPVSLSCGNLRDMEARRQAKLDRLRRESVASERGRVPRIQQQYLEFCEGLSETHVREQYRLNRKKLDLLLGELFQELFRSGTNSTIVVFTSVAGNLEGAHGLWGSCYNGFEGSIRVPCIVYMPSNLPAKQRIAKENLAADTSSVDLLPTLLRMAGVDAAEVQRQLLVTHKMIPALVGRDLCRPVADAGVYYQSEDVKMPLTRAASCSALPALAALAPQAPPAADTPSRAVAVLKKAARNGHQMKICYYSSDPRSCDGVARAVDTVSSDGAKGANGANTAGRAAADSAEEWELFDLTTDPREKHNLVEAEEYAAVLAEMKLALALRYRQCCELNISHEKNGRAQRLSLFSCMSKSSPKEVKWRQFYILLIALVISVIAVLMQYLLS